MGDYEPDLIEQGRRLAAAKGWRDFIQSAVYADQILKAAMVVLLALILWRVW